jgi:twinfilin-like protein
MKHTVAIPGLLVHAEDVDVSVDQKIEIHEHEDLVFEEVRNKSEGDGERGVAKFRSMYERNAFAGTELVYESMQADKKFFDAV